VNRPVLALAIAAITSTSVFAAGGSTPPVSPPISAWPCDDGAGTTLSDALGLYPGDLQGGMGSANWSSSTPFAYASNRALIFDGTDDRVELSSGHLATGRSAVTLSAWFWWYDDGTQKEFSIWGERDECQYNVFALTIERRAGVPNGLAFSNFVRTLPGPCGLGSWYRATSPSVPTSSAWHHAAAVLDPVDGMQLYLDGVLVATNASTAWYIGHDGRTTLGDVHTVSYDGYWNGAIDEVALFDYALSPEEIGWLYGHSIAELDQPASYCTPGTTTNGCNAAMSATGTPSAAAASGFVLSCTGVEGQKVGLVFYGVSGPKASVWAPGSTSFLCVKSPVQRLPSASSGGTAGACDGALSIDLLAYLASHASALGQPFAPGDVAHAQAWFRDPSAPGTTNLSDGVHWTMRP
jgi:hypothetical protein